MLSKFRLVGFFLVAALGIFLRVHSFEPFKQVGSDEDVYRKYVEYLGKNGVRSWPQLMEIYVEDQEVSPITLLPPTRITFLLAATTWRNVFQVNAVEALRAISTAASILALALSSVFAWRLGGRRAAFGVLALMAVAPTQISMAHRALIDGFFGLLALIVVWALWENLQKRNAGVWLLTYGLSLALLVATKENAAFVYLAVIAILALNRWLRFGQITKTLLAVTLLAPAIGLLTLVFFSGSPSVLATVFQINVTKSSQMLYASANGDGPWFRYLTDLLLVSPAVMLFAIGGAFGIERKNTAAIYLLTFVLASYLFMANVRNGMNLRYANMWDFPLRWIALIPLLRWRETFSTPTRSRVFFYSCLAVLCLFELANYLRIFVDNEMYDPVTIQLMRALKMLQF